MRYDEKIKYGVTKMIESKVRRGKLTTGIKIWIDNAGYRKLLWFYRYSPEDAFFFKGEIGDYFEKVMLKQKAKCGDGYKKIDKEVGWPKKLK